MLSEILLRRISDHAGEVCVCAVKGPERELRHRACHPSFRIDPSPGQNAQAPLIPSQYFQRPGPGTKAEIPQALATTSRTREASTRT
jgi:hypothetical protein